MLQKLEKAIDILREVKFSLIISVMGTHACYHHVVVVVIWKGMIIKYIPKYTFPLTNDSLRQIHGVNTTFAGVSCGYGIFPPTHICNSMDNISIEDWGINEYNIKGSSIRKYTSNRRSESLSLNNRLNICEYLCVYVCLSPCKYLGGVIYCHTS